MANYVDIVFDGRPGPDLGIVTWNGVWIVLALEPASSCVVAFEPRFRLVGPRGDPGAGVRHGRASYLICGNCASEKRDSLSH